MSDGIRKKAVAAAKIHYLSPRRFRVLQRVGPMASALINAAVHREDRDRKQALLDRLFAIWFTRFVYNQIWEDPEADLEALAIDPSYRVVTFASAGCNLLNYLSADPAAGIAVDLNPAPTALTRLKIAALHYL